MRFSMTGRDGNAVITVECADSEDTHSPNDLEKVCTTNRDLHSMCSLCIKGKWSVHAAQLISCL